LNIQPSLSEQIRQQLIKALHVVDPHAAVHIKRTSLGWIHLFVESTIFEEQTLVEREGLIDGILSALDLNLGRYPFANYELLTSEEIVSPPASPIQLPLWSEILMAPDSDQPVPLDEGGDKRPFVVTFYSFKGGVGRTTALALVAGLLAAKGRKVAILDFDLEAPGLSYMFPSSTAMTEEQYGVLDYLHQRYLTPNENYPAVGQCIRQIVTSHRGELYLVPAGEYDEGYIHRLTDLDVRLLYQRDVNPIYQLLDDLKEQLDPDIILVDARTGFTETGAVALFDLADLAIICFSPTEQSFAGLRWVVQAARKQRDYRGKPDLRFLLTPMPSVDPSVQRDVVVKTEEWIAEHWGEPLAVTPNELYYQVSYNPAITMLNNAVDNVPPGLLEPYQPVAAAIDASLPEIRRNITALQVADSRQSLLNNLVFRVAVAQEMAANDIPAIFQRTGDFPQFLQDKILLIRGAKGTGKSLLFRLFVELSAAARTLAKPYADLDNVHFVPGHGRAELRGTILTSPDLDSYERQAGVTNWQLFWPNYALLQICSTYSIVDFLPALDPELVALSKQEKPLHQDIIAWLVKRALSPTGGSQVFDELKSIDLWLKDHEQKMWLLYDELDAGFGQDYSRRRVAIESLFAWWLDSGSVLKFITPKVLLREDIWIDLNFTNKGHYTGRSIELRWDEADLWRLILRQILSNQSAELANVLPQEFGVGLTQLDNSEVEQLRKNLYPLWGERMGKVNKAYTHNWVRNRITDSRGNRFPRSLIILLQKAIEIEKNYGANVYEVVLRPRALIDALPYVSQQRVDEVRNEYPEFEERLVKLRNERSPISVERLGDIWSMQGPPLNALVSDMAKAGILQQYTRSSDPDTPRYAVAELYLYGLGMTRLGQR
jgi:MinD-like ATPase involved in chromosome partitioning or flagellar assembly